MFSETYQHMQWQYSSKNSSVSFKKNKEYENLLKQYEAIQQQVVQSYVGAYLVQIFKENPEIECATVRAHIHGDYDDQGGVYNFHTARIDFKYNVPVDSVNHEHFDAIQEQFYDNSDGLEYYTALCTLGYEDSSVSGVLCRSDIADLLLNEEISGLAVFRKIKRL